MIPVAHEIPEFSKPNISVLHWYIFVVKLALISWIKFERFWHKLIQIILFIKRKLTFLVNIVWFVFLLNT